MNWISAGIALLFGLTVMGADAHAKSKSVMSGALDICQSVDGGVTVIKDGVEACCAQEVNEFDDGHIEFGVNYCVACTLGTDDCTWSELLERITPQQGLNSALTTVRKQAPKN